MDKYKTVNGTAYHPDTPNGVIRVLEASRQHGHRIRIFYGDRETGLSWMEEWGTMGTVGRSTGSVKIPLLILTARSMGGGAILDHCIIRITDARGGDVLYTHPYFHLPKLGITQTREGYTVTDDVGKVYVSYPDRKKAERWIDYITGRRNTKW